MRRSFEYPRADTIFVDFTHLELSFGLEAMESSD